MPNGDPVPQIYPNGYVYITTSGTSANSLLKTYGNPLGGGGCAPFNGFEPLTHDLCKAGHVAGEILDESDGKLVALCVACGDQLLITPAPGGLTPFQIKRLLGEAVAIRAGASGRGFSVSELLGHYAQVRSSLDEEEIRLRQARDLLKIALEVIEQIAGAGNEI